MIRPDTVVVLIDHGWANMKTEDDVFTSGVSEITTETVLCSMMFWNLIISIIKSWQAIRSERR